MFFVELNKTQKGGLASLIDDWRCSVWQSIVLLNMIKNNTKNCRTAAPCIAPTDQRTMYANPLCLNIWTAVVVDGVVDTNILNIHQMNIYILSCSVLGFPKVGEFNQSTSTPAITIESMLQGSNSILPSNVVIQLHLNMFVTFMAWIWSPDYDHHQTVELNILVLPDFP